MLNTFPLPDPGGVVAGQVQKLVLETLWALREPETQISNRETAWVQQCLLGFKLQVVVWLDLSAGADKGFKIHL